MLTQVFGDGTYYLMETLMRVGRTFYGLGSLLTDAKVHSFLSLSDYPYTYKYKTVYIKMCYGCSCRYSNAYVF